MIKSKPIEPSKETKHGPEEREALSNKYSNKKDLSRISEEDFKTFKLVDLICLADTEPDFKQNFIERLDDNCYISLLQHCPHFIDFLPEQTANKIVNKIISTNDESAKNCIKKILHCLKEILHLVCVEKLHVQSFLNAFKEQNKGNFSAFSDEECEQIATNREYLKICCPFFNKKQLFKILEIPAYRTSGSFKYFPISVLDEFVDKKIQEIINSKYQIEALLSFYSDHYKTIGFSSKSDSVISIKDHIKTPLVVENPEEFFIDTNCFNRDNRDFHRKCSYRALRFLWIYYEEELAELFKYSYPTVKDMPKSLKDNYLTYNNTQEINKLIEEMTIKQFNNTFDTNNQVESFIRFIGNNYSFATEVYIKNLLKKNENKFNDDFEINDISVFKKFRSNFFTGILYAMNFYSKSILNSMKNAIKKEKLKIEEISKDFLYFIDLSKLAKTDKEREIIFKAKGGYKFQDDDIQAVRIVKFVENYIIYVESISQLDLCPHYVPYRVDLLKKIQERTKDPEWQKKATKLVKETSIQKKDSFEGELSIGTIVKMVLYLNQVENNEPKRNIPAPDDIKGMKAFYKHCFNILKHDQYELFLEDVLNSGLSKKMLIHFLVENMRSKEKIRKANRELLLYRKHIENSPFAEDYLPLDMLKLIMENVDTLHFRHIEKFIEMKPYKIEDIIEDIKIIQENLESDDPSEANKSLPKEQLEALKNILEKALEKKDK